MSRSVEVDLAGGAFGNTFTAGALASDWIVEYVWPGVSYATFWYCEFLPLLALMDERRLQIDKQEAFCRYDSISSNFAISIGP